MSCKFDEKKCVTCGKYNGCLLQTMHSNILEMTSMIKTLAENQQVLSKEVFNKTNSDDTDVTFDIDEINKKINIIANVLNESDISRDELNIDISQIKSVLTTMELKVDNILKASVYNL